MILDEKGRLSREGKTVDLALPKLWIFLSRSCLRQRIDYIFCLLLALFHLKFKTTFTVLQLIRGLPYFVGFTHRGVGWTFRTWCLLDELNHWASSVSVPPLLPLRPKRSLSQRQLGEQTGHWVIHPSIHSCVCMTGMGHGRIPQLSLPFPWKPQKFGTVRCQCAEVFSFFFLIIQSCINNEIMPCFSLRNINIPGNGLRCTWLELSPTQMLFFSNWQLICFLLQHRTVGLCMQ